MSGEYGEQSGHKMKNTLVQAVCAAVLSVPMALAASAATVAEADFGAFSGDWANPTVLADDVTAISGTTAGNIFDIFRLAVPAAGGELTLTFGAGDRMGYSYSAGTTVKYSYAPFPWGWSGDTLGAVQIAWWSQADKTLSLTLDPMRGEALYLALYNTHGAMDYGISGFGRPGAGIATPDAPLPATVPAAVPVPAAVLLLGSAAGGMGIAAAARRIRPRG